MPRALALTLLLVPGCTAPPPAPLAFDDTKTFVPHLVDEPPPPPGLAQKLKLEISLKHGLAAFEVGQRVEITAKIRNISREPIAIVLPGDGSSEGWREPHLTFAGTIDAGQGVQPLTGAHSLGRCGLFDSNWHDEVVTIPPGGEQPLGDWIPAPSDRLAMQEPGRISFSLRYAYTAGADAKDFNPGAMTDTPAFELVSNTLQIQRNRSLVLSVRPRDTIPRGRATTMAHYYQLEAHNASDTPRELPVVVSAELRFPPRPDQEPERHFYAQDWVRPKGRTKPITIPPGESVVLPDLATFGFPYKTSWSEDDLDGALELLLKDTDSPVPVIMDAFNHGYAR
jgi:hypothetical protein